MTLFARKPILKNENAQLKPAKLKENINNLATTTCTAKDKENLKRDLKKQLEIELDENNLSLREM